MASDSRLENRVNSYELNGIRPGTAAVLSDSHYRRVDSLLDTSAFFFILMVLMLNPIIGVLTPLSLIAFVPIYCVVRRYRLISALSNSWPVFLLPGFALLSAVWSIEPSQSLRSGTLYLLTVLVGAILGAGIKLRDAMYAVFFAFYVFVILSWLFGTLPTGTRAFMGLMASKNAMGEVCGGLAIVGVCVLADSITNKKPGRAFFALFSIPLGVGTLVLCEATSNIVATAIALLFATVCLVSMQITAQMRTFVVLLIVLVAIPVGLSSGFWFPLLFESFLEVSGKDADLTGRVYIWARADTLIAARPILGLGFDAFWRPGNLDAEAIWRAFGIGGKTGFRFHSTYREITVNLGYTGLALFSAVALAGLLSLLVGVLRRPSAPLIFFAAMFIASAIKMPFESIGFGSMQTFTVLAFASLTIGFKFAFSDFGGTSQARTRRVF